MAVIPLLSLLAILFPAAHFRHLAPSCLPAVKEPDGIIEFNTRTASSALFLGPLFD